MTFYKHAIINKIHLYNFWKTFGRAHVWTTFSYGYRNESKSGWLLNPECSRLILFTKSKKSARSNLKNFSYTYYANDLGEPSAIKSASQLPLDDALDKWQDLQLEGWTFGELEIPEWAWLTQI